MRVAVRCWMVEGSVRNDLVRGGVVERVKKGCSWRLWR